MRLQSRPVLLLALLLVPRLHPQQVSIDQGVQQLSAAEVQTVVAAAASAAGGEGMAVVVVDRPGRVLAIYRRSQATDLTVEKALMLARSGAFFSSNLTPLSSRTVRSISRPNFPEGIPNQPAGALYGIENTNRGCPIANNNGTVLLQPVPTPIGALATMRGVSTGPFPDPNNPNAVAPGPNDRSLGIGTVPGGFPLFRNGAIVIGGVGVSGLGPDMPGDLNEYAGIIGSSPFLVNLPLPDPGSVYIDGFRLPFALFGPSLPASDGIALQTPAGLTPGSFDPSLMVYGPFDGQFANEGWLVGPVDGQVLKAGDVASIIDNSLQTALLTRAAIRLPVGKRTSMVISVADLDGTILGLFRMPDSTIFSIDVALSKARNVVYFSGPTRDPAEMPGVPMLTAVTNRTIGFGSQPFFPSGIFNSQPGPFYNTLYNFDTANPCTQGHQAPNNNQSGIVFFPGSAPLYRNGVMVGGLGVSGDGVEQDDFVTNGGTVGYEAPVGIRADQVIIRSVRLPYFKFPRNPEQ
ncbi:MAG TPA: heme-binding protein [Bryobacteraceae bacterium]|nr:heme-binding protein [Bryobacteraceae bacterium]